MCDELYLVSNNGIGDNLFMIGAINYLSKFYKKIHFIIKKKNYDILKDCYNKSFVNIIKINSNGGSNEKTEICKLLKNKYDKYDVIVCGSNKKNNKNKITNKEFLKNNLDNNIKYDLNFDTINNNNYKFIQNFYKDCNLNINIFYEYFNIPFSNKSKELYDTISNYNVIFLQENCSNNIKLNIEKLLKEKLYEENIILICSTRNLYNNVDINNEKYNENIISIKKTLTQKFVLTNINCYYDTIINSDEIYIIDSCIIGFILPLVKTNKLKANTVRIINRCYVKNYKL